MRGAFSIYKPELDGSRARWVVDKRNAPLNSLNHLVPPGFEKYLRICPPGWRWPEVKRTQKDSWAVDDYEEKKRADPVRWSDVANLTGTKLDRQMEWRNISPPAIKPRLGQAGFTPPWEGEITLEMVNALFETFIRFTPRDDQGCIAAFWEGFGLMDDVVTTRIDGIGQQKHLLFQATLSSVRDQWVSVLETEKETPGLTPQAIWPINKSWYFSVPFERHTSYFGGPNEMAVDILSKSNLEVYEVFSGDRFVD